MKVSVIGPGAMGCLFAARLMRAGFQTTLVDYKPDRVSRLQNTGVTIEAPGETFTANPRIALRVPNGQDLVIVLTKSYRTSSLEFPVSVPVLTLQNGLNNVEMLCSLVGSAKVLAGTTSEAATLLGEGRVRHAASGVTKVGSWTSCPCEQAVEMLQEAGIKAEVTNAPGQMIWEKAAINSAINPLTALLNVPNGRLLEIREVRQLMRDLVVEAAKVAATEGYRFDYSLIERAEEVCQQTGENISSMLQDVRGRRETEIEAINGEIMRRGQMASLPTPRTRVVYQLVKGLELR